MNPRSTDVIDLEEQPNSAGPLEPALPRLSTYESAFAGLRKVTNGREIWAIADQALVSGTNFLTNVIVARSLGVTEFGVFALAWMAMLFFYSMQMALISAPMMSIGPKTPAAARRSYWGAVSVQELVFALSASALISLGLKLVATLTHQPGLARLTYPLCIATVAYLLQDFVRRYFFTTRQSRRAFLNDAVSCLPQLPIIFFFLRLHLIGIPGVLWIFAITSLVGVGLGAYWLEPISFTFREIKATAARHWTISRWTAPSWLLSWMSTNFIAVLAPVYYGAAAAGALRASQNIVAVSHIWILGMDNVMPAEAAHRLHESGIAAMSRYLKGMALRWGGLTAGFAFVIGVAPQFWLRLIYGPQFAGYGTILRMYCIVYLLIFIGGPVRAALQAMEYTAPYVWAQTGAATFALLAGIPLTRKFGLIGVLTGSIATLLILQGIFAWALARRLQVARTCKA
jgi:O-antigen/teichoic acid export membrane protein